MRKNLRIEIIRFVVNKIQGHITYAQKSKQTPIRKLRELDKL